MSVLNQEYTPTWETTVHNDARKFGHINEFSEAAWAIGYEYISWCDRVYLLWEDETGHVWSQDTQLLRENIK